MTKETCVQSPQERKSPNPVDQEYAGQSGLIEWLSGILLITYIFDRERLCNTVFMFYVCICRDTEG